MPRSTNQLLLTVCAALALLGTAAVRAASAPADRLAEGFRNPPDSAKPHTWWHWINGNITREGITADLEAMKRAGIGGAQIFNVDVGIPAGKVPFMSERWREMIVHAAKEADRLGLELCMHNCAGWSSSGGPWNTPEHAMQALAWSEVAGVHGPARFSEMLPLPKARLTNEERPSYYRDIAVFAYPTPPGGSATLPGIEAKAGFVRGDRQMPDLSSAGALQGIPRDAIRDLTTRLDASGRLTWDVPAGEWTILRMGHTPTGKDNHPAPPEGRGLEVDKLSREALDAHWAGMMATVLKDVGPLAGKSLNNSLIDSYEVGSQNWTPKFREEFRKRRGYDPVPYLPAAAGRVVGTKEESERFLWDFRRTICDLFADNYYAYFGELCHKNGLKFSTEPYGNGSFDDLQCGGLADIPMGEFWVGGGTLETCKLAASAGHTNGRQVIGAESFTADDRRGRWLVEPYSVKTLGDMAFCLGINRYIFHRYAHQPWMNLKPGMTMGPWGTHLERTVTWWDDAAAWLKYVARCQYLLQSGRFVADALYFNGEEGPNTLPFRGGLQPALPAGYDYDGCDWTALSRASVRDGVVVLPSGMRYRVLMLPRSPFMTPAVLRKIAELVRDGAMVVGPRPVKSPSLSGYPACDAEVERLAAEVWGPGSPEPGEHSYGNGRVVAGKTVPALLDELRLAPDFEAAGSSAKAPRGARLVYIHRTVDGGDWYFVSNQRYRPESVDCTFRVAGKTPELWHPDTGEIETAAAWEESGGRTTVPLHLDPAGSVFVVFRHPSAGPHLLAVTRSGGGASRRAAPRVEVRKAFYEPANGRGGGADVTSRVAAMVAGGQYAIEATNESFGDPTPNIVKRLRVEYLLDGKPMSASVGENETLELAQAPEEVGPQPFDLTRSDRGAVELVPWQSGDYRVRTRSGQRSVSVPEPAAALPIEGGWDLRFPAGWGAPPEVRLDRLISWPQHPDAGVRYFSGTAEYEKTFDVPKSHLARGRVLRLDLGRVKNFAAVTLNGKELPVLWKAPFALDVTGLVKPGTNRLRVRVTNLWPNRLIGDEQYPPDLEWRGDTIAKWPAWLLNGEPRPKSARYTFTTWRFYRKDSPLLESGLLGPVVLRSAKAVPLPE